MHMQRAKCHPQSCRQTGPAPHLEWFTSKIWPVGTQSVHIRPAAASTPNEAIEFSRPDSQLLMKTLDHIARDPAIQWTRACQAVLRAFYETLTGR
jgi:hypothetical protein